MNKPASVGIGTIIGLLIGYPASYFFQAGAIRAKLSLGGYIQHIDEIIKSRDLAPTAIGVWIGCVVVCALVGLMLSTAMGSRRNDAP